MTLWRMWKRTRKPKAVTYHFCGRAVCASSCSSIMVRATTLLTCCRRALTRPLSPTVSLSRTCRRTQRKSRRSSPRLRTTRVALKATTASTHSTRAVPWQRCITDRAQQGARTFALAPHTPPTAAPYTPATHAHVVLRFSRAVSRCRRRRNLIAFSPRRAQAGPRRISSQRWARCPSTGASTPPRSKHSPGSTQSLQSPGVTLRKCCAVLRTSSRRRSTPRSWRLPTRALEAKRWTALPSSQRSPRPSSNRFCRSNSSSRESSCSRVREKRKASMTSCRRRDD